MFKNGIIVIKSKLKEGEILQGKSVYLEEINGEQGKKCTKCNQWKPLTSYHNDKKGVGGKVSKCKECVYIKKEKKFNKETVIAEIVKLDKEGANLSYLNVHKNFRQLEYQCKKTFGNFKDAIKEAGLEYQKYVDNPWRARDTEQLLEHLKNYINKNGSPRGYSKEFYYEYVALLRRFSSFNEALEKIGEEKSSEYDKNKWDKEKIINELKKSSNNGLIHITDVSNQLYGASQRKFGSFLSAVKEAGLKCTNKRFEKWDKSKIIDTIKQLNDLSYCVVENQNQGLVGAARRYFGSWESAINQAGFSYDEIVEDKYITNHCGKKFERLLDILFSDLGISYTKYDHKRWNPDYVFKDNKWGDAKLSEWTDKKSTIKNYEKNCRFLTIIFMRGNKNKDAMITSKTRLISVHQLIKQLPRHKQEFYIKKINNIENELEAN